TIEGVVDAGEGGNTIRNETTAAMGDQPDPTDAGNDLEEEVVVDFADIEASDDNLGSFDGAAGVPNAGNAYDNDTINGQPVDPDNITGTVLTAATPVTPGASVPLLDPVTGQISVPPGTPNGIYTIEYQICEELNPTNCETATVTVEVEATTASVSGVVFLDEDEDDFFDSGESLLPNWIVDIVDDNGNVIAQVVTDSNGYYEANGLPIGEYSIVFRNPQTQVAFGEIEGVILESGVFTVNQDLPIDPSGVVYNSITRDPVGGATATLLGPNGDPLPTVCFVDPSQQNQITAADGYYRFDVLAGAASQCPTSETKYTIAIVPPQGFSFVSTVIAPQNGAFDPTGLTSPVEISPNDMAPTEASPVYYLMFELAQGDPDVVNNHIPIDPFLNRDPLMITKTSTKRSASVGDLIPYQITVRNAESVPRAGVTVIDILPAGLKYVTGTSSIDSVLQEPAATNFNRELEWRDQFIPANASVTYDLVVVVGAGVSNGEKVNTGIARDAQGNSISNRGTATIRIAPSPVFDCSELLGKVFEDRNRNGYQDKGEPGVPGVRLATVNGLLVTTDEFGRYHIACAAVPNARIGSNFVLKVDTRTLPLGWKTVHDNPQSIRLTRGKFGELNFGVAPPLEEKPTNLEEKGE
ncbi:MAG: SdrD B-like domain-containing protein, partial [Erythrobacter sp.]